MGVDTLHLDSRLMNVEFSALDRQVVRYAIKSPRLSQGTYRVSAYLCTAGGIVDQLVGAKEFTVAPVLPYPCSRGDCVGSALIYPEFALTSSDGSTLVDAL
jgi:hypothetical protein